jgi:hypothetical protein
MVFTLTAKSQLVTQCTTPISTVQTMLRKKKIKYLQFSFSYEWPTVGEWKYNPLLKINWVLRITNINSTVKDEKVQRVKLSEKKKKLRKEL